MISAIILGLGYLEYKRDCKAYGKGNLACSLGERVFAFIACGFWGLDVVALYGLVQLF